MKLRDALDAVTTNGQPAQVYSQPYETPDGTTVIAVAKVRGTVRGGEEIAVRTKPIGVFAIRGGEVKWAAAVDQTPIALLGVLTGLVSATLATVAMVRRPPWPDIRQTIS
ncbi:MAG TPA: hypothetical protein VH496_03630 [Mycobacterium sp.]|jgi:hypothetical protein